MIYINRFTDGPYLLKEVIAHEMAHYVCSKIYRDTVESHGPEWTAIARSLGSEGTAVSKKIFKFEPEMYTYKIDGDIYILNSKQFKLVQHGRKTKKGVTTYTFVDGKLNKDTPYEIIRTISYSETKSRKK